MARSSDSYDSASSQFFICNADSTGLDGFYAAFGHVVEGMDVVDAITVATVGYTNYGGAITDKTKQAVIEYIKVLDDYTEAEYSLFLQLLETKQLISLESTPLVGADMSAYGDLPVHGSMGLTKRGQQVLELLEIQGVDR